MVKQVAKTTSWSGVGGQASGPANFRRKSRKNFACGATNPRDTPAAYRVASAPSFLRLRLSMYTVRPVRRSDLQCPGCELSHSVLSEREIIQSSIACAVIQLSNSKKSNETDVGPRMHRTSRLYVTERARGRVRPSLNGGRWDSARGGAEQHGLPDLHARRRCVGRRRRRGFLLVTTYNIVEGYSSPCWFVALRQGACAGRSAMHSALWSADTFRGTLRTDAEPASPLTWYGIVLLEPRPGVGT